MGSPEGTFDTSLHEAVRYGDLDEVKLALQHGYDPNLLGLFQWSALHEAAHNGDVEILKLLLEKKGDPNKCDNIQRKTAMHYATEQGNIECLKLLVAAGGKYNIKDDTGRDCLDMATPAGRKILERLKVRDLMLTPVVEDKTTEYDVTSMDSLTDDQSSLPESLSSSRKSSLGSNPGLGYLHLSVEYHSIKSTLKIRVWQVTDLFLPPSNTSMIHSIYVKSYLVPDKKRESKRKTEEIKVENSETHIHWKKHNKTGIQHVFTPANFKFTKPLEYAGVKPETIKEKHLSIEVCITQKYSHRSFLIGMVNMSLKSAVKKIVREKLPLIPCMNHTIPASMKVYSASDLSITDSKVFYSNPNFRVMIPEDSDGSSEKAVSDPDLQGNKYSPAVEVDMNHEYRTVPQVPKLDLSNAVLDESGYSSEFHVSFPGDLESPDSDSHNSLKLSGKSSTDKASMLDKNKVKVVTRYPKGIPVTDLDEEEELEIISIVSKPDGRKKTTEKEKSDSRPQTPTWDYYDMPTDIVSVDSEKPSSPWREGAAPVVLPMTTTMHILHAGEGSLSKDAQPDKGKKKLGKKSKSTVPGKAVPLIPKIVITNPEKESMKAKSKSGISTPLQIPDIIVEKSEPVKSVAVSMEMAHGVNRAQTSMVKETTNTTDQEFVRSKTYDLSARTEEQIKRQEEKSKLTESKQTPSKVKSGLPSIKSRLKKLRKSKDAGSKGDVKTASSKVSDLSGKKSPLPGGPVRIHDEVQSADLSSTASLSVLSRQDSEASSTSSVVVDMEKLSFASSDSFVVELDDDVSITELPEDSQLFSHMSEASLKFSDMESGMDYQLPERVSPTKYMIPLQVYMDDDTSCDESLATDRSDIPTTEL